jgi:hypothetical protein
MDESASEKVIIEPVPERGIVGTKSVKREFLVPADAKIVTCCGCGFPVNQNNPRCLVMAPNDYMGTYGPCCAPTGRRLAALRRRIANQRSKATAG